MRIAGIDHIQLAIPAGGEDRAREFYRDILQIPEIPKPPHLARRGGCWFESGHVKLHVGVDSEFRAAKKAHAALIVDGLDTLVATLEACGYSVRSDEPFDGRRRMYVDDPFGNRIELIDAGGP